MYVVTRQHLRSVGRSKRRITQWLMPPALLLLAACSSFPVRVSPGSVVHVPLDHTSKKDTAFLEPVEYVPKGADPVFVRFMGTTCMVIRVGDAAVFCDPYFTHRKFSRALVQPVAPDESLVESYVKGIISADLDGVEQLDIFISHAHIDHVGGVKPALEAGLKESFPNRITIHGSMTTFYLLKSLGLSSAQIKRVRDMGMSREWIPVKTEGRVKVDYRAHENQHPPHFACYTQGKGKFERELARPPRTMWGYRMGACYAYEFRFTLPGGDTRRVVLVGSASLPILERDRWPEEEPDLLLLGFSLYESSPDGEAYPGALLEALKPRNLALVHWNNFFQPRDDDPTPFVSNSACFFPFLKQIDEHWSERDYLIVPGLDAGFYIEPENK